MDNTRRQKATYCLLRPGGARIAPLIRRNKSIALWLGEAQEEFDHVVFLEEPLSWFQRRRILKNSGLKNIKFEDVSSIFPLGPGESWDSSSAHRLGYSLMCRFFSYTVWGLLDGYDEVFRIDSDLVMVSAPTALDPSVGFLTGAVVRESHRETLATLPNPLKERGLTWETPEVPYTNFFGSRVDFWLQGNRRRSMESLVYNSDFLENRWGDAPLIGAFVQSAGDVGLHNIVSAEVRYFHGSNFDLIADGKILKGVGAPLREVAQRCRVGSFKAIFEQRRQPRLRPMAVGDSKKYS